MLSLPACADSRPDPQKLVDMRAGIPVRSQKRYDVYPNLVESAVAGQ